MTDAFASSVLPPPMSIAAVERDCGIPKDTLRIWERRYGFPAPLRDANDERLYPADQVARLRLLRRLIAAGHRPGKVVALPAHELLDLIRGLERPPARRARAGADSAVIPAHAADAAEVLGALAAHDAERLRSHLAGLLLREGLGGFAGRVGPGLTHAVGAAWARGELEIHQEHLFTDQFTGVLRNAIGAVAATGGPQMQPRVLLTTLPGEPHGLGLLMAEAMFALEGCACVSLGVQTPVRDIALAARAHRADVLALSFSEAIGAGLARAGLADLRALAPAETEIWAGGACPGLRDQPGVHRLRDLAGIAGDVARWRQSTAAQN